MVEKLNFKEMQRKIQLEHKPYQEITLNELDEMRELQRRYIECRLNIGGIKCL